MKKIIIKELAFPFLLCISLGLAPFSPEPHIVGKLKWIAGGADGMQAMDYFDLVLHGFPWVILIYKIVHVVSVKSK